MSAPGPATVDCHFHIFDDRFTQVGSRKRAAATVAQYREFQASLGLSKGVLIAPSSYGIDNACLLEAMRQFGSDDFRAVVIAPPDAGAAELRAFHAAGARGLRLYAGHDDFPDASTLRRLAGRMAEIGWHLQFVGEVQREAIADLAPLLAQLPCDMVFDHFGFAPQPTAEASRTADALRKLLDTGRVYVKLSGMYIQSRSMSGGDYQDFDALARDLVARAPERMLWGSDWPHTLALPFPHNYRPLPSVHSA
jgi:D-galactarolactone isomerase